MKLTKTANLMLLLLLAGSTDAFATPRRARGLVVTRGGSDDLPPTKPKPLAVELAVDVGIVQGRNQNIIGVNLGYLCRVRLKFNVKLK